jgi:hypothetical protein
MVWSRTGLEGKINIIEFMKHPDFLNFHPEPMQECFLTAFYGLEFRNKSLEQMWCDFMELAKYVPMEYWDAVLVWGRRSGKSKLIAGICCYEAFCVDRSEFIPDGEFVWVNVIAQGVREAKQIGGSFIKGFILDSKKLSAYVQTERAGGTGFRRMASTQERIVLTNGVAIQAMPCKQVSGRGYATAVLFCDEVAFWNQATDNLNADVDIYNAFRYSMLQFGETRRCFLISSKALQKGLLWERFKAGKDGREPHQLTMLAATETMRTGNQVMQEALADEKRRDPIKYAVECGTEWAMTNRPFFRKEDVEACFVERGQMEPNPGTTYYGAVDPAFRTNRFGICIGHWDHAREMCVIDYYDAIDPRNFDSEAGIAVNFVLDELAVLGEQYSIVEWITDQYTGGLLIQVAASANIAMREEPFTPGYKKKIYSTTRSLFTPSRRIEIPKALPAADILHGELLRIEVKWTTSGDYAIGAPDQDDATDDVSDTLAVVASQAAKEYQGDLATLNAVKPRDYPDGRLLTVSEPAPAPFVDFPSRFGGGTITGPGPSPF